MGTGEIRIRVLRCRKNEERLQELGKIWELVWYLIQEILIRLYKNAISKDF